MRLSDPLLPAEYIQNVLSHDAMRDFKSSVFDSDSHDLRVDMRSWIKPLSPDSFLVLPESSAGFTKEARRTYLHVHAREGDILAMSEMIACGATIDVVDKDGDTPLHLVGQEMTMVKNPRVTVVKADGSGRLTNKKRLYTRLAWAVRILVEQHANGNIRIGDDTLLDLVCSWKDWDLITLLLKHGATSSSDTSSRFATSTEKKRFSELLKTYGPGYPRPARKCRCWSGKTVAECHGKGAIPYPLKYMCVCGSSKTYERCCHKRGKFVTEIWDPASETNLMAYEGVPATRPSEQKWHDMAAGLLQRGVIDPAFAYAMDKTGLAPMPHGRTTSRTMRVDMQTAWNKQVDRYIAQGTDSRSKEEIERSAKIGAGNGALFRVCGGDKCQKVESSQEKFSLCAKCKIAVYCSRSCQKSSWPTHRKICGSAEVEEQALPSQVALKQSGKDAHSQIAELIRLHEVLSFLVENSPSDSED